MAQNQELRVQSSTPSTPSSSVVKLYVNNSGILHMLNSNGTAYQVGTQSVNSISMLGQTTTTGLGVFLGGAGIAVTGIFIGSTGNSLRTMYLGNPAGFLPVTGPSGENWAIPAYVRA